MAVGRLVKSYRPPLSGPRYRDPRYRDPRYQVYRHLYFFGAFDTEEEAEACLKYIKGRFARGMLGILKITQDNTADKWARSSSLGFFR